MRDGAGLRPLFGLRAVAALLITAEAMIADIPAEDLRACSRQRRHGRDGDHGWREPLPRGSAWVLAEALARTCQNRGTKMITFAKKAAQTSSPMEA